MGCPQATQRTFPVETQSHPKGMARLCHERKFRSDMYRAKGSAFLNFEIFRDPANFQGPKASEKVAMVWHDLTICFLRCLAHDDRIWCPKPGRFSNVSGSTMMQRHRGCEDLLSTLFFFLSLYIRTSLYTYNIHIYIYTHLRMHMYIFLYIHIHS